MSDKKPPTQYITLKPLQLCKDNLGQTSDEDIAINKALAQQVRLSNKKIEILSSLILLKKQLLEVNNELEVGQESLDELQGVAHAGKEGDL